MNGSFRAELSFFAIMRLISIKMGVALHNRVRVKVCGITQVQDALACAHMGVDAIGLVFYEPSPRHVSISQAQSIVAALPPFITVVGLVVNPSPSMLHTLCQQVAIDVIQFHGDETPVFCAQHSPRPWFKALTMHPTLQVEEVATSYYQAGAQGVLLDAYVKGARGGTGVAFDWERFPQTTKIPYILAGGLNPSNVAQAIAQTQPWAVDVSSGVESAPGIKDSQAIQTFVLQTHKGARGV